MSQVNFVTWLDAGHRANYEVVLERVLADHALQRARPPDAGDVDLYPMLDDGVLHFTVRAIRNALAGRRTVGLFFRSAECFRRDKWKYRVKYLLFSLLRRLPDTALLTILPYAIEPRFAKVSTGFIYDLQLWDAGILGLAPDADAVPWIAALRGQAAGRRIVVAIGEQSRLKGFDLYAKVWNDHPEVRKRFLFVAAGRVTAECAELARQFADAGGVLVDRYITDQEIAGLYGATDIVWSCYPQTYNQASGIFGRAFQFGKPVIVRSGSLLVALAGEIGLPILEFEFGGAAGNAAALLAWAPALLDQGALTTRLQQLRDVSVDTLLRALGRR